MSQCALFSAYMPYMSPSALNCKYDSLTLSESARLYGGTSVDARQ